MRIIKTVKKEKKSEWNGVLTDGEGSAVPDATLII
jgi:hypothetical protein